jgi:hypothetical protein
VMEPGLGGAPALCALEGPLQQHQACKDKGYERQDDTDAMRARQKLAIPGKTPGPDNLFMAGLFGRL